MLSPTKQGAVVERPTGFADFSVSAPLAPRAAFEYFDDHPASTGISAATPGEPSVFAG
ncbi:hypothetical protein [Amycolatopsis lexingtonensis]|uniref:hypothetical protein n=1 Tax=Amycolatopsis lexingtonensis TaxID=218822 RepID=UPI003F7137C9